MAGSTASASRRLLFPMIVLGGCPTDPPIEETASTTIVSSNPTSSSSVPTGPTDSDVDTTVGIPTTSTGGSTDTTGDVPPEVCFDPPPPPAPTPVPMFDNVSLDEQFVILDADIEPFDRCPETVTRFPAVLDDVEMEVIIYRPAEGDREMSWPDGTFNFIPFTHGNGQDGQYYPALHTYLAQRGFVVASITNDGDADPIVRTPRLLCMTEALLDGTVEWTGSGKLNGRFALTGHSTGGLGAFLAAKAIRDDVGFLDEYDLVAVAALAPNRILPGQMLTLGPAAPDYFVLQGTGDGDTINAAFSNYDSVQAEISGAQILGAPRKALVWAYNVEHNRYGGRSTCTSSKGVALATTYLGGFLLSSFFDDPTAKALFFQPASPAVPPAVGDSSLGFWTEFGNVPQVYGTSSQQVSPSEGYKAYIIDGFENDDVSVSDGGLSVFTNRPDLYDEIELQDPGIFSTSHLGSAAASNWLDGDTISWVLDLDARAALAGGTSLTFRIGAAVDVVDTDQCDEVVGELPVVSLIVSDGVNPDVIVDLSPFGRQALPEARLESVCTGLPSLGCAALENMQTTFRINLQDLCVMSDSLSLSNVKRLGIRFDGPGGILFLDDFDIRTVPGEPDVACRCEQ